MTIDVEKLANILEAAMLVAGKPTTLAQFESLFADESEKPSRDELRDALVQLQTTYDDRGIELVEVASGYRLQARQSFTPWLTHIYQEKAPRYSRALLETLVLIAYRQPITRGEIEDVRGVAVSTNIVKTLIEREWVRILGHRDVPGRPALLGTTRQFLDYFNLKRIDELPTLSEIKDLDQIDPELAKEMALLEPEQGEVDIEQVSEGKENVEIVEAASKDQIDDPESDDTQIDDPESDDTSVTLSETPVPDLDLNLGDEQLAPPTAGSANGKSESANGKSGQSPQVQANGNGENPHVPADDSLNDAVDEVEEPLSATNSFAKDEEFADSTQHDRALTEVVESETLH